MDDEPTRPRPRRRASRPAGTVGGDETVLRSSFPAPSEATAESAEAAAEPAADAAPPLTGRREHRGGRRAPDDQDVGWGAPVDDSNDDRLSRERPPHW